MNTGVLKCQIEQMSAQVSRLKNAQDVAQATTKRSSPVRRAIKNYINGALHREEKKVNRAVERYQATMDKAQTRIAKESHPVRQGTENHLCHAIERYQRKRNSQQRTQDRRLILALSADGM